jgi:protein-S-isoprenylcysteine O-methyltransferase Ste14
VNLFIRAVLAFLVLPGVVAFVVPLLIAEPHPFAYATGIVPLVVGAVVLCWCVREFYVAGRGRGHGTRERSRAGVSSLNDSRPHLA